MVTPEKYRENSAPDELLQFFQEKADSYWPNISFIFIGDYDKLKPHLNDNAKYQLGFIFYELVQNCASKCEGSDLKPNAQSEFLTVFVTFVFDDETNQAALSVSDNVDLERNQKSAAQIIRQLNQTASFGDQIKIRKKCGGLGIPMVKKILKKVNGKLSYQQDSAGRIEAIAAWKY